jgi:carboxymethylenebutenolidase
MIERDIVLTTQDGAMPCFVVHPDEDGPFPVVLFYMDALGIREELRDMARRFATAGYYVMLPNLFYRDGGPSFDAAPLAQDKLDPLMVKLNDATTTAMTVRDTAALIAAAASYPKLVRAIASLHGGRLVTDAPDSPHRQIAKIDAEAYFGWADKDPVAPPAHMTAIAEALKARGLPHRIELHEGALHGFTFPERYCYHKRAAELVWARLFALFKRALEHPAH